MRKTQSELLARALRAKEKKEGMRRNIIAYFLQFSQFHRPWLKEVAEKYKENGVFPMFPIVILPSYYANRLDKEVAAFASLLLRDNCDIENIQAFREMMGESPHEWFKNREFIKLSISKASYRNTGGALNWKIAKVMDRLWGVVFPSKETTCVDESICNTIDRMASRQWCSRFDVLTYLMEDCGVGNFFYKLRLLLMTMCTDDGFGLSLWEHDMRYEIRCPIASEMRQFFDTWFPDWKRIGNMDNAIRLFGFDKEYDFFYAWLGYKELQKRNLKGCGYYATRYQTWYELGTNKPKNKWIKMQPEISF